MIGDAEFKAPLAGRFGPGADDVALRPHPRAVPAMKAGGVIVKIVVMIGKGDEIARARFRIQIEQGFGPPLFRPPAVVELHEAGVDRMAVILQMMLILFAALDIHVAGIPVARLRHALRRPVRPDAELGVAKPIGRMILRLEGFPVGPERPGLDALSLSRQRAGRCQRASLQQQIAFAQHHRAPWKDRLLLKKGSTKS